MDTLLQKIATDNGLILSFAVIGLNVFGSPNVAITSRPPETPGSQFEISAPSGGGEPARADRHLRARWRGAAACAVHGPFLTLAG